MILTLIFSRPRGQSCNLFFRDQPAMPFKSSSGFITSDIFVISVMFWRSCCPSHNLVYFFFDEIVPDLIDSLFGKARGSCTEAAFLFSVGLCWMPPLFEYFFLFQPFHDFTGWEILQEKGWDRGGMTLYQLSSRGVTTLVLSHLTSCHLSKPSYVLKPNKGPQKTLAVLPRQGLCPAAFV